MAKTHATSERQREMLNSSHKAKHDLLTGMEYVRVNCKDECNGRRNEPR